MKKLLTVLLVLFLVSCGTIRIVPSSNYNDEDIYFYEHGHYYNYNNYYPYFYGYKDVYNRYPYTPKVYVPRNNHKEPVHRPNSNKNRPNVQQRRR